MDCRGTRMCSCSWMPILAQISCRVEHSFSWGIRSSLFIVVSTARGRMGPMPSGVQLHVLGKIFSGRVLLGGYGACTKPHRKGQGPRERGAGAAGGARGQQQAVARDGAGRHRWPGAAACLPRRAPQPATACRNSQ